MDKHSLRDTYTLRDGRIPVLIGDTRFPDGTVAVFALGAVLQVIDNRHATGDPDKDMQNGLTFGRVEISEKDFKKVLERDRRGDYITLHRTRSGKVRWGFVTKRQLIQNGYIEPDEFHLIKAWVDMTTYFYNEQKKKVDVEDERVVSDKKKRKKADKEKKKRLRRKERRRIEREEWI